MLVGPDAARVWIQSVHSSCGKVFLDTSHHPGAEHKRINVSVGKKGLTVIKLRGEKNFGRFFSSRRQSDCNAEATSRSGDRAADHFSA